jgi:hypothetical protein
MANLFAKAKTVAAPKTAAAKKTKEEIALAGIQQLAELKAMAASIEAVMASLEGEIKEAGFSTFLEMDTKVRPESFKGVDGYGTCSVEMRKRGTNSALNADEVEVLERVGLTPFEQIITPEMFGINPAYAGNEVLMNKVSKALEKIVPEDFIILQEGKSKLVVSDEVLDAAFKLKGDDRAEALRLCTTMALKPRLNADYPMEKLSENVAAILAPVKKEEEVQKAA